MAANLLTVKEIEAAKATGKAHRLADGGGLYLLVGPTGAKSWQYRYRHDGRQQTSSLGKLEVVGLADRSRCAVRFDGRPGQTMSGRCGSPVECHFRKEKSSDFRAWDKGDHGDARTVGAPTAWMAPTRSSISVDCLLH